MLKLLFLLFLFISWFAGCAFCECDDAISITNTTLFYTSNHTRTPSSSRQPPYFRWIPPTDTIISSWKVKIYPEAVWVDDIFLTASNGCTFGHAGNSSSSAISTTTTWSSEKHNVLTLNSIPALIPQQAHPTVVPLYIQVDLRPGFYDDPPRVFYLVLCYTTPTTSICEDLCPEDCLTLGGGCTASAHLCECGEWGRGPNCDRIGSEWYWTFSLVWFLASVVALAIIIMFVRLGWRCWTKVSAGCSPPFTPGSYIILTPLPGDDDDISTTTHPSCHRLEI
eukprot:TRINITY_DN9117_c0_g1_i4.p1 TRINITY_DN9117_c0_g1~~TRINITY_DN9117_c0_g1_i4.p1  ORF type:complete len:280 (+),score=24.56 TRINITY_DN9117_c0_g1_i4:27-866(+)